ncbi:hypothetical protein D3C76_1483270 [compost metagenome]
MVATDGRRVEPDGRVEIMLATLIPVEALDQVVEEVAGREELGHALLVEPLDDRAALFALGVEGRIGGGHGDAKELPDFVGDDLCPELLGGAVGRQLEHVSPVGNDELKLDIGR